MKETMSAPRQRRFLALQNLRLRFLQIGQTLFRSAPHPFFAFGHVFSFSFTFFLVFVQQR